MGDTLSGCTLNSGTVQPAFFLWNCPIAGGNHQAEDAVILAFELKRFKEQIASEEKELIDIAAELEWDVYLQLKQGYDSGEIAKDLKKTTNHIAQIIFRLRRKAPPERFPCLQCFLERRK